MPFSGEIKVVIDDKTYEASITDAELFQDPMTDLWGGRSVEQGVWCLQAGSRAEAMAKLLAVIVAGKALEDRE